jgi:hypothetical protein
MFIYRGPVPRERRTGDGDHVDDEVAKVGLAVEDKKGDDEDNDKGG